MADEHKEDSEEAKILQSCEKIQLFQQKNEREQRFDYSAIMFTARRMLTLTQKRT